MDGFPPPDDETYSGRKESGAETAVKPGDEGVRHLRDSLKGDAQGYHEGNYEIAFETEGFKY